MNNSNLPPGVTEGMIPGNRPEDEEFENQMKEMYEFVDHMLEEVDPWEIVEFIKIGVRCCRITSEYMDMYEAMQKDGFNDGD